MLIIPFRQDNSIESECWVLNLGNLDIASKDFEGDKDIYEHYNLKLENIKMQYYPTQDLLIKTNKLKDENKELNDLPEEDKHTAKRIFDLVENFSIHIGLNKILGKFEIDPNFNDKSRMDVGIKLSELKMNLTPMMYKYLMKTSEFIKYSKDNTKELMENERTHMMQGFTKIGYLYVLERKINDKVWNKYYCIFKGSYLYFFKNPSELKAASNIYIRGAKLTYLDTYKDRSYVIHIKNRYNSSYISADDVSMIGDWKKAIEQKIKDLQPVRNVINQIEIKPEELEVHSKTNIEEKPKVNHEIVNISMVFYIGKVSLALRGNEEELIDLVTENFEMKMKQYPELMEVHLNLQKLEMNDHLFKFTDPSLTKFITSNPSSNSNSSSLISIDVALMEKTHPDYHKEKTDVTVGIKFGYLNVNFKPDVMGKLMRLYLPQEQKENLLNTSNTSEPEIVQKTAYEKVQTNVEDPDHIMVKLNFTLSEISLKMIHQRTHVCMALISLNDLSVNLIMKPLEMVVEVGIRNIQLFDTTNYPNTIDSNLEYDKIVPYEMIGTKNKTERLMTIKFKSIDLSKVGEDKISSFVNIEIKSIQLNVMQQPLLRLIDYLTGQMLPSLTSGDNTSTSTVVVTQISPEDALKNIQNPTFMDIKLNLHTPIINLKPTPTSSEYIEVRLGDLIISNKQVQNKERWENDTLNL